MVTRPNKISEEILNAFIDGEIESEEKIDILRQLSENPELTRRACELIRTKELLRSAYSGVTPPVLEEPIALHTRSQRFKQGGWGALAASLLAALLLWQGAGEQVLHPPSLQQSAFSQVAFQQAEESAALRIVFHLTSSNPLRMGKLLDDVESLLQQTGDMDQNAVVEVIANGEGMDLYRSGVTSFGERIHEMTEDHQNLRFVACQRTIDQLESDGEGRIHLLPDVVRAGSGISQVIQRQQQGWSYIQI